MIIFKNENNDSVELIIFYWLVEAFILELLVSLIIVD